MSLLFILFWLLLTPRTETVEARMIDIPKVEASITPTTTNNQKHFIDVCQQIAKWKLTKEQCIIIEETAIKYWIHPKYIMTIWLSENILGWSNHWDGWCSKWWYQMNSCARTKYSNWRITNLEFVRQFERCSLDFACSTDWTAERIVNYYCQWNKIENLQITNANCLSRHQWYYPAWWYKTKISKNLHWVETLFY